MNTFAQDLKSMNNTQQRGVIMKTLLNDKSNYSYLRSYLNAEQIEDLKKWRVKKKKGKYVVQRNVFILFWITLSKPLATDEIAHSKLIKLADLENIVMTILGLFQIR